MATFNELLALFDNAARATRQRVISAQSFKPTPKAKSIKFLAQIIKQVNAAPTMSSALSTSLDRRHPHHEQL
jgi:hypothetical protein